MSYKLFVFALILISIDHSFCSTSMALNTQSKVHKGYCEYHGILVKRGKTMNSGRPCEEYSCSDDYTMTIHRWMNYYRDQILII